MFVDWHQLALFINSQRKQYIVAFTKVDFHFLYLINIHHRSTGHNLALDFRVTVLEENGEGDGNSSVAELEVRVETLEGTAADHETRISTAELDIDGKRFPLGLPWHPIIPMPLPSEFVGHDDKKCLCRHNVNEVLEYPKNNTNFQESKIKQFVMIVNSEKNKSNVFILLGLQMTDVELDSRVTALEENGGGFLNGEIYMHCVSMFSFLNLCKIKMY